MARKLWWWRRLVISNSMRLDKVHPVENKKRWKYWEIASLSRANLCVPKWTRVGYTRLRNYWNIFPQNLHVGRICVRSQHVRERVCVAVQFRARSIATNLRRLWKLKPTWNCPQELEIYQPANSSTSRSLVSFGLTISPSKLAPTTKGARPNTADSSSLRHRRHHLKVKLATINCWRHRRPPAFN